MKTVTILLFILGFTSGIFILRVAFSSFFQAEESSSNFKRVPCESINVTSTRKCRIPQITFNSKTVNLVTPVARHAASTAYLTRLANTLMHVRNLHWILVDIAEPDSDSTSCARAIADLIERSNLAATYVLTSIDASLVDCHDLEFDLALASIESFPGVFYFGSVEFVYPLNFFEEIRKAEYKPALVTFIDLDDRRTGLTLPDASGRVSLLNADKWTMRRSIAGPFKDLQRLFSFNSINFNSIQFQAINNFKSVVYGTRGKRKPAKHLRVDPRSTHRTKDTNINELLSYLNYIGMSNERSLNTKYLSLLF